MIGLLYFHQGWTDIMNCLPLINIYAPKYKLLYVLVREEARALITFYIRGLRNVSPIFSPHSHLDSVGWSKLVNVKHHNITGFELIAHFDGGRPTTDKYHDAFKHYMDANSIRLPDGRMSIPFERGFYEPYGLPYSDRVDKFVVYRDPEGEEKIYNSVVKQEPYVCVHNNPEINLFVKPPPGYDIIELNKASDFFFDYIRVLQHAKEIHLIDSSWAGLCYLLDAKYGMFHETPIYVYCYRDFHRMFTEPVKLANWTIIMQNEASDIRASVTTAVVSFASGGYAVQQKDLVKSIQKHSPNVHVFPFTDYDAIKSPQHRDNPYAFKVYALETVRKFGYKTVLWCDSVLRLVRPVESILPIVEETGVYLQKDGWSTSDWANDRCLEYFGLTRDEASKIEGIYACFMAFNFSHPLTDVFFEKWKKSCDDGIFKGAWKNDKQTESSDPRCKGHRHDQVCAEIITHQMDIPRRPCVVIPNRPDSEDRYFTTWHHS